MGTEKSKMRLVEEKMKKLAEQGAQLEGEIDCFVVMGAFLGGRFPIIDTHRETLKELTKQYEGLKSQLEELKKHDPIEKERRERLAKDMNIRECLRELESFWMNPSGEIYYGTAHTEAIRSMAWKKKDKQMLKDFLLWKGDIQGISWDQLKERPWTEIVDEIVEKGWQGSEMQFWSIVEDFFIFKRGWLKYSSDYRAFTVHNPTNAQQKRIFQLTGANLEELEKYSVFARLGF